MPTDVTKPLFDAIDVSSLSGNVSSLIITFLAISVMFVGAKFIKKVLNRA